MIKHRGLKLEAFVESLPWELFSEYFDALSSGVKPDAWSWLNPKRLVEFLNDEAHAEETAAIVQDFTRINDLTFYGTFLLRAYSRTTLEWDQEEPPTAASMRLFLRDRDAFEYGWTLYVLRASSLRRFEYCFPAGALIPSEEERNALKKELQGWFSSNKNGEQCQIATFRDGDTFYLRVARGKKLRTITRWREFEIAFETFRPAFEDVLTYDGKRGLLCFIGGSKADRERYIDAFARCIAGDEGLATIARQTPVFTLMPFRNGTFSYDGNAAIKRIRLSELSFVDIHGTLQCFKGPYLRQSLEAQNLVLSQLDLRHVGLQLEIETELDKKPFDMGLIVQPPFSSDLSTKHHADIIEQYLKQQGVKRI